MSQQTTSSWRFQKQIECALASIARVRRRDARKMGAHRRLVDPAEKSSPQHAGPVSSAAAFAGNHQRDPRAASQGVGDKEPETRMRCGLSQAMQVEHGVDLAPAARDMPILPRIAGEHRAD